MAACHRRAAEPELAETWPLIGDDNDLEVVVCVLRELNEGCYKGCLVQVKHSVVRALANFALRRAVAVDRPANVVRLVQVNAQPCSRETRRPINCPPRMFHMLPLADLTR